MMRPCAIFLCGIGAASATAQAIEVERSETTYHDKRYQVTLIAVVDASVDRVQAVLLDYERYPKLDSRILETAVVDRPQDHEVLLYTKLRACFGVFCRNVKRVERVQERPNGLIASVLPDRSEVLSGETQTECTALDGRTRIRYTMSIAPGFWLPPLVGRQWMLRTLKDASIDLFRRVEQEAIARPLQSRTTP